MSKISLFQSVSITVVQLFIATSIYSVDNPLKHLALKPYLHGPSLVLKSAGGDKFCVISYIVHALDRSMSLECYRYCKTPTLIM